VRNQRYSTRSIFIKNRR